MENNSTALKSHVVSCNTTKLEFNDFSFVWVIEDFIKFQYYNQDHKLESPIFEALNNKKNHRFQLELYCNTKHCLCINFNTDFVKSKSSEETAGIKYSIIDNSNTEIYLAETFGNIYNFPPLYHYRQLARIEDILSDNILRKGRLMIKCRICFHNKVLHSQSDINTILPCPESKRTILADLENLLESEKITDVKLVVGTEELRAHKFMLAARSPVFSSMFESDMKENRENIVEINDISPEIMKEVLRFIYTDKANIEALPIMDLLAAADKYQIESLRTRCLDAIVSKLNVDNVAEILTIVDRYEIPELRRDAIDFFIMKKEAIAVKNNWDEMVTSLSPPMLMELVTQLMKKI